MAICVFFSLNINYRKLYINLPRIKNTTTMKPTVLYEETDIYVFDKHCRALLLREGVGR